ncbi:hypothetical protein JAAARDRAFT_72027 [Jaapia argillacea MUCL 33604]|uniref:F-box domain-containing protein n=1 Tax=Jaapia argillacea MUCL 33604 TaxID=933084 RepID=A0A067PSP5_9AGAM|nr:hypothetical protein JAAARDRAFT_72027 [Jaapia argillacea MUCL 33604]
MARVRTPLIDLPGELLAQVLDPIIKRSDIRSLASTCRFFRDILVPDYLDCRQIETKLGENETAFWQKLATHPALSRIVRTLTIADLSNPGHGYSSEVYGHLITAIKSMSGLLSFRWDLQDTPIGDEDLWEVLRTSCPQLRHLKAYDGCEIGDYSIYESEIFAIENLEEFQFEQTSYELESMPSTDRLRAFLFASPNLRVLDFQWDLGYPTPLHDEEEYDRPDFTEIFRDGNWLRLTTLKLKLISCDCDVFNAFLSRHPSIEALSILDCIDPDAAYFLDVTAGSLPNLAAFSGSHDDALDVCQAGYPLRLVGNFILKQGGEDESSDRESEDDSQSDDGSGSGSEVGEGVGPGEDEADCSESGEEDRGDLEPVEKEGALEHALKNVAPTCRDVHVTLAEGGKEKLRELRQKFPGLRFHTYLALVTCD